MSAIVFFSTTAFLLGYMWTRLVYSHLLVQSESGIIDTVRSLRAKLAEARSIAAGTAAAATRGVGKQPNQEEQAGRIEPTLADAPPGVPIELPPVEDTEDPNKGRFKGSPVSEGRELTATVREIPDSDDWFLVQLELVATDRRPLVGDVWFYLHPSFPQEVERVSPTGQRAELEIISYGAFTVGVVADNGDTILELDLARLASAPRKFRQR